MIEDVKDVLLVDYKSGRVKFDLTYGYLDKIYDAFNFRTQKNENIENFILNLDNESMPDNQYLLLEDMTNNDNQVYNVELSLDGLEYKGVGKIYKFFNSQGLGINLHLLEDN